MNLIEYAGEPCVSDTELASHLGFCDKYKIRSLITRNLIELQRFGQVSATVAETSPTGGRPGKAYLLNRKQALYLCTKSETPRAAEVTIQMVEVFDAWMKQRYSPPTPRLSPNWTMRLEALDQPTARLVIESDVVTVTRFAARFVAIQHFGAR